MLTSLAHLRARLTFTAAAVGGAALLLASTAACTSADTAAIELTTTTVPPVVVPAAFAEWVATAPDQCDAPQITPEFIAAQLYAESFFDPNASGPAGTEGAAQLLIPAMAQFLQDDDGNGTASPYDIGDAVHALVRADCDLVAQLAAEGKPTDPETIAAAYHAGTANIDLPEARAYARAVLDRT